MKLFIANYLDKETKSLINSFAKANLDICCVVIQYNGDIPLNILNPFSYYTGFFQSTGAPMHFDELEVPMFYEIRHKDAEGAIILDGDKEIANIKYFPNSQRWVKEVIWLSDLKKPVLKEFYSLEGKKYSLLFYDENGHEKKQIFIDKNGNEKIIWDLVTKQLTLMNQEGIKQFSDLKSLVQYFIEDILFNVYNLDIDELYINNLSTPLMVANRLGNYDITLFWQHDLKESIPNNLYQQLIKKTNLTRIYFDSIKQLEIFKALTRELSVNVTIDYLGPLKNFTQTFQTKEKALTITKSDHIEFAYEIAREYPTLLWTIAAPTKVSEKLKQLSKENNNITVIPSASKEYLNDLLNMHDFYLDLNKGTEVDNVIEKAYDKNMLIISMNSTQKSKDRSLIFFNESTLLSAIGKFMNDKEAVSSAMKTLHELQGPVSTIEDYKKMYFKQVKGEHG